MLKQLLLFLVSFLIFVSCKKDADNPPEPSDFLLSGIELENYKLTFTYNSKGQLSELNSIEGPNAVNHGVFEYKDNKLVKLNIHWKVEDLSFDEVYTFRYDDKGNLIEGNNETMEYTVSFLYNNQNKLTGCIYRNKTEALETDENGNIFQKDKISKLPDEGDRTGEEIFSATYKYDNKPNPFRQNNLGLLFIIMDFNTPDYALLLSHNSPTQVFKEYRYNYSNPAYTEKITQTYNYSSAYDLNSLLIGSVCQYKSESYRDESPTSPIPGNWQPVSSWKFHYTRK